jgi:hypothetical protein
MTMRKDAEFDMYCEKCKFKYRSYGEQPCSNCIHNTLERGSEEKFLLSSLHSKTETAIVDEGETILIGKEGGMKDDLRKLRWDLLPLDAIEKIVEVMTFGAEKYEPNNWRNVKISRYFAALFRHITAWYKGEKYDSESGLTHLSHALCNLMFILWLEECKDAD